MIVDDEIFVRLYQRVGELEARETGRMIVYGPGFFGRCHVVYRLIRWVFTEQSWRI